ncbi:hypothetical protein RQP46_009331 [Phenoliferia psychrophenolica]
MSGLLGLVEHAKEALHHHKEGDACMHEHKDDFQGGIGDQDSAVVGEISGAFGAGMGGNDAEESGGGPERSAQAEHHAAHHAD